MLVRALNRPVGRTWLATSVAAALILTATAATSQEIPDGEWTNSQTQNGDILADQVLNVVQNDGLSRADSYATGNSLQTGNDAYNATLHSYQVLNGQTGAHATIQGTNTGDERLSLGTPVYASAQAIGNYSSGVTQGATFTADTRQDAQARSVDTTVHVTAPNNSIYVSGEGNAITEVNHTAYQVSNGRLNAQSWQNSATEAHANVSSVIHYSPSPNAYNAVATNNSYAAYSDDRGSQEHHITQSQSAITQARSEVYAGTVWNMTANAEATGNNVDLQNKGGSLVVSNTQSQAGEVQSQAVLQADEYGTAYATASGIGNNMVAGNNDIYVRIDNNQVSSGGVDVTASFDGNAGYDAYLTADAIGNQAMAYACSECKANMGVDNTQVNNSDVNATATASVVRGRSIVSTARATGNSATYYVGN